MALKKTVWKSRLNIDELNTILIEIENTLNSRPLTYLSEENFHASITPNHLLHGRNVNIRNDSVRVNVLMGDEVRAKLDRYQTTLEHFRNRFYKEYVTSLRERHFYASSQKGFDNECKIRIGDVLLIKDDKTPRWNWKKGKVESLVTGNDGLVCGAVLRTYQEKLQNTTLIRRPLQLLIPLELPTVREVLHMENQETLQNSNDNSNDILTDPLKANTYHNDGKRRISKRIATKKVQK